MYRSQRPLRPLAGALVAVLAAAVAGCSSSPPEGSLSGTVTYKGQPVTEGEVQLYLPAVGVGATAPLNGAGKFRVDTPIRAGKYEVCVVPPILPPTPGEPAKHTSYPNIPKKARDQKTSGLTAEVKTGRTEVVIELMD